MVSSARLPSVVWIPLVLLLSGTAPAARQASASSAPVPPQAQVASEAEQKAHERMLAWLAAIAKATDEENPFLGSAEAVALATELEALGPGTDPLKEAQLHLELGTSLLRLGRTEEAIEHLRSSYALAEGLERPRFARSLAYELGIAYLRLAENRNCVARHTSESCVLPIRGGGVHVDREGSLAAIRWLREALATAEEGEPESLAAKWLLNLAHMTLGTWPDELAPGEVIAPAVFASEVEFPRFGDLAGAAGVAGFNLAGGAIAEDFDGDGLLDLLLSDWDTRSQARFFRNAGDGTFVDRTSGSGLEGIGGGLNMIQADYDDDGWIDVLLLRGAWWGRAGKHPKSLLRNLGGGRFVDVSYRAGIAEPAHPTQAAGFADHDRDGDLDLYVGNESNNDNPAPGQLFRNEGNGAFTDVARAAGVENSMFAKGVAWGDYDGDRFPDLYVSNLGTVNRLYRNRGDGTFEDVARKLGVSDPIDSFAVWFWDYDNDGALDLYVTSYYQSPRYRLAPVVASFLGLPHAAKPACLYRNDGQGGFRDVTVEANLTCISLPMGANFGDLDNDGFPDFYLGTGYPGYDGLVPNVMYWNRRGKTFSDVSAAGGFGHLQKGHGVLFADLDNDGDQDVFEQMGGAFPGDGFSNVLFVNPGFGNHWLRVTLVGKTSNRCALGARIRAEIRDGEERRSVFRHVGSGGSFGANPLTQHLGLGRAEKVEVLEVYWPMTDRTQTFRDLPADAHVRITEDEDDYRIVSERRFVLGRE